MTTAEQSSGTADFASSYKPGAGLPETENTVTGAAMHRDLYRKPKDPAELKKAEQGQARVLGLGFLVFFGILTSISLWINGALYPFAASWRGIEAPIPGFFYPEEEEPAEGQEEARPARLGDAINFQLAWSDDERSAVSVITDAEVEDPKDEVVVHVRVNGDWSRITAPKREGAKPTGVELNQGLLPAGLKDKVDSPALVRPGHLHAWHEARLMNLFPTRYLFYAGLILGGIGLVIPALLVPFYRFWMRFVTAPLGFVNTRLILGVVYFLVVTPMAIVIKFFGTDRLRRAKLPDGESYWVMREKQRDHKHFEKGF